MELSEQKKKFLSSLGLDVNSLPLEFSTTIVSMEDNLNKEEIDFITRESLTGTYKKKFCVKDIIGSANLDYAGKTWIEAFELTGKRGDKIVEKYFDKEEYYTSDLKKEDQTYVNHDSPIELYEADGKFYIKGGNIRIILMMIKYLAESTFGDDQEKIDNDFTFYGEVNPIPYDKELMYMINLIRSEDVIIKRTADEIDGCGYTIRAEGNEIHIDSKEDFYNFIKMHYIPKRLDGTNSLEPYIEKLIKDFLANQNDKNKCKIFDNAFPNIKEFTDDYLKLRKIDLLDELYDNLDMRKLDYNIIKEKVEELAKDGDIEKLDNKEEKEESKEEEKDYSDSKLKPTYDFSKEIEEKRKAQIQIRQESAEQEALKKEIITKCTKIPSNLDKAYDILQDEEVGFLGLAKKLGVKFVSSEMVDERIAELLDDIRSNMRRVSIHVDEIDMDGLKKQKERIDEAEEESKSISFKEEYSNELKAAFVKNFDIKVQDVIKEAKISMLQRAKSIASNEEIGFFGKLSGENKIKEQELDYYELMKQVVQTTPREEKITYSFEDSLSDLYQFIGNNPDNVPQSMLDLVHTIEDDKLFMSKVNKLELERIRNEKMRRDYDDLGIDNMQLMTTNEKGKFCKEKNPELMKQILINNEVNKQRTNWFGDQDNKNEALEHFIEKLDRIKELTTIKRKEETKQLTDEEIKYSNEKHEAKVEDYSSLISALGS